MTRWIGQCISPSISRPAVTYLIRNGPLHDVHDWSFPLRRLVSNLIFNAQSTSGDIRARMVSIPLKKAASDRATPAMLVSTLTTASHWQRVQFSVVVSTPTTAGHWQWVQFSVVDSTSTTASHWPRMHLSVVDCASTTASHWPGQQFSVVVSTSTTASHTASAVFCGG